MPDIAADEEGMRRELKGLNKSVLIARLISSERFIQKLQTQTKQDCYKFEKAIGVLEVQLVNVKQQAKNFSDELRMLAGAELEREAATRQLKAAQRDVVCCEERVHEMADGHQYTRYDDGSTQESGPSKINLANYEGDEWRRRD